MRKKLFNKINKFINNRHIYINKSIYLDYWKDFKKKNLQTKELINKLKENLDLQSCKNIDIFLKRKFSFIFKFTKDEIDSFSKATNTDMTQYKGLDKSVATTIYYENGLVYLQQKVKEHIRGKSVIDGGALWGDSALVFKKYEPDMVYSFEFSHENIQKLQKIINLNNAENVIEPVCIALGQKDGYSKIMGIDNVKTTSLDNFAKNKKIGLIKLDIEGNELEVIKGAETTIRRDKPILLISIYHKPEDFFYTKTLIESWALGYKFIIRDTEPLNQGAVKHLLLIGWVDE